MCLCLNQCMYNTLLSTINEGNRPWETDFQCDIIIVTPKIPLQRALALPTPTEGVQSRPWSSTESLLSLPQGLHSTESPPCSQRRCTVPSQLAPASAAFSSGPSSAGGYGDLPQSPHSPLCLRAVAPPGAPHRGRR